MGDLRLSMACGFYDRTYALATGAVKPEGIDLTYLPMEPHESFFRMSHWDEFDVCEMGMSQYIYELSRDNPRWIALPAFPSRVFRHHDIFINTNSGVTKPEDLKGKRVGLIRYHMTAAVWMRGMMSDEYGVKPADMNWIKARYDSPGLVRGVFEFELPEGLQIDFREDKTLEDLLIDGEIDAMFGFCPLPSFLAGNPNVQRLFPNARQVELDYYRKTHIHPMMHTVVMKREIYDANPWIAQSLLRAFEESKRVLYRQMLNTGFYFNILPFAPLDHEEAEREFGKDFFPYGVRPNRPSLDAFTRYMAEQGLAKRHVTVEELFPKSCFDLVFPETVVAMEEASEPQVAKPGAIMD